MAFKSLIEHARKRRGWSLTSDKITFSVIEPKNGSMSIRFSIGPLLVERASFIKGDKIDILWDSGDDTGLIRRDNEHGRTCQMGKSGRMVIQIGWSEGMPRPQDGKPIFLSGTEIRNGEILFDLPTHKDTVLDNVSEISVSR